MNDYLYDVFISYSRANSGWAKQFAEDLMEALKKILKMDVSVFIDTSELHGGDTWFGKIMSSVENCGALLQFIHLSILKARCALMSLIQSVLGRLAAIII